MSLKRKLFKYIERTQERFKNVKNPSNQDLLNSSSDHADCPYASVFSKNHPFSVQSIQRFENLCLFYREKQFFILANIPLYLKTT